MKAEEPRVALVHDFLLDLRGAERVFLALCDMFPQADLFTAIYDPAGTAHLGILNSPDTWKATFEFLTAHRHRDDHDH